MKIFKKLLPVVIGLSLIIVIAITIVIVNATNSKTPKLSNGEESYLQFGNLQFTITQFNFRRKGNPFSDYLCN